MAVEWNGQAAAQAAKEQGAKRLQRTAQWFWQQHVRRLSVSNPRPYEDSSKRGEYPRKRTGNLIGNVIWGPMAVPAIISADYKVRMGLAQPGRYGAILEFFKHRLGFLKTLQDLRPLLKAMLEARAP
jgi:hypothetical protein